MQMDEAMTQYVDRVGLLERRAATDSVFKNGAKICTLLRGVPAQLSMTRDLIRKLRKKHYETVTMLVAKISELWSDNSCRDPKKNSDNAFMPKDNGFIGTFFQSGKVENVKRD